MRAAALVVLAGCASAPARGHCVEALEPGDLVISEVFAKPAATGAEWFEIYNASGRPLSLEGLTLVNSRGDGSSAKAHVMSAVIIAPEQYFALGNVSELPGYLQYAYGSDLGSLFDTGTGKLALKCGDNEIDSALYDSVKAGHSRELSDAQPPDASFNDDAANWCEESDTEFAAGDYGTPGGENDCTPPVLGACSDGATMREIVQPAPGDLVITEVMPSPTRVPDIVGEWFEVVAKKDVDLNGLGLDRANDTLPADVITSSTCLRLSAGSFAVFARSSDMTQNGGLPAGSVLGTFTFSLVASAGDVQLVNGANVVDSVRWTSSTNGKAIQLDPDLEDAVANDMQSNFCDAQHSYGLGDLGTPAAQNDQCALLPQPGMCDDGGTPRAIVPPAMGSLVITEVMPHPNANNSGPAEWFEVTNTGSAAFDLNGLGLDRAGDSRAPDVVSGAKCLSLAPGAFAVFARGADPTTNGGIATVAATFGLSMVDTAGNVQVVDPASCGTASPYTCTSIYDAVSWSSSTKGASSQVKPGMYTTTANDSAGNFCPGVATYGNAGNLGTPGADNSCM
ncbi:MAG: lamin tail domain-containing protein [Deltaproteobacteria bacterium]|nr:lamin tail domain-containing protein [Deltaproteobacteria bacterium]